MASTIRIWKFTPRKDVTMRSTPTTLPSEIRGQDTAIIFSPVSGSLPWKGVMRFSRAPAISSVPGELPAVRPEVDTSIRPLLLRNCSSIRAFSSKPSADWVAF